MAMGLSIPARADTKTDDSLAAQQKGVQLINQVGEVARDVRYNAEHLDSFNIRISERSHGYHLNQIKDLVNDDLNPALAELEDLQSQLPDWKQRTIDSMLDSAKMIGFVPTKDYEQARAFYEGKLGFGFVSLDQYALVMRVGGHMIRIAKIPNFTPLQSTILGWEVSDISATATWLKERGVPPEKFPFVQDRELGIWTAPNGDKVAWFKDPDGNILSVSQHK